MITNKNNLPAEKILANLRHALRAKDLQNTPAVIVSLSQDGWRASIGKWISGPCGTMEEATLLLVDVVHAELVAVVAAREAN